LEYRVINKDRINDIVDMRLKYLREDFQSTSEESFNSVKDNLPKYFENHLNRDLFVFGAFYGDKIVSTAFLLIIEKPCNPRFTTGRIGEIFSVYTLEEYRRQGIAYNLLKMLMEFAKNHRLDLIELKATKEGYPLYQKLGFSENAANYVSMKFIFNTNET